MNKTVKGSIAGAAGVALLMGSFGTYAVWSDQETLPGGTVTSGELDIAAGAVTWEDVSVAGPKRWQPGDLLVPGDMITRTQTFTIKGTGENLRGTIALGGWDVDSGGFGDLLDVDVEVTSSDAVKVAKVDNTPGDFTFAAPFGEATLTAVVTYAFTEDATAQEAQGATATIADSTITITQSR